VAHSRQPSIAFSPARPALPTQVSIPSRRTHQQ